MNKVILIGRLTGDPEAKQTQSGTHVSRYRLAVDRPAKQGEEKSADFIPCIAFSKSADFANKHLRKGMKIAVEGSIRTGSYEKDGRKVYTTDVVVDRHEFVKSLQTGMARVGRFADVSVDDFEMMDGDNSDLPF